MIPAREAYDAEVARAWEILLAKEAHKRALDALEQLYGDAVASAWKVYDEACLKVWGKTGPDEDGL